MQRVEVDAQMERCAESSSDAADRRSSGLGVDGSHLAKQCGDLGAFAVGEQTASAALDEGDEVDQGQLGLCWVRSQLQGAEFGPDPLLVVGPEQGEVVGLRSFDGATLWQLRRRLTGSLWQGPLDGASVVLDEHVSRVEGVVQDMDAATAQGRVDQVSNVVDRHGAPLLVDPAAISKPEQLLDEGQLGGRAQHRLGGGESLYWRLAGLGVDVGVIPLGEPGLEEGVELVDGQKLVASLDLALELLLDGAVESFADAATLGDVGLGVDDLDADRAGGAGGMEPGCLEAGAVVEVEPAEAALGQQQAAEAESQRREVFVEVVAALGDVAAEVVDEDQQQGTTRRVVVSHPDVGSVVEVGDDQLEGSVGADLLVGRLAEPVEPSA